MCARALEWLELRAMRSGRRPVDSTFVHAFIARELAREDSLERGGQWDAAEVLAREVADDARGWPDGPGALARADELQGRAALRDLRARARRYADRDEKQAIELQRALAWARDRRDPPSVAELLDRLGVPPLLRQAAERDSVAAWSAQRLLARIHVFLAFYEPRAYLAAGQPARAVRMLEAASRIASLGGEACSYALRVGVSAEHCGLPATR
jgi:hypothetical protein